MNWGPFCGCALKISPAILDSLLRPLIFGNSHIAYRVGADGVLGQEKQTAIRWEKHGTCIANSCLDSLHRFTTIQPVQVFCRTSCTFMASVSIKASGKLLLQSVRNR